jgi:hypothetical protein
MPGESTQLLTMNTLRPKRVQDVFINVVCLTFQPDSYHCCCLSVSEFHHAVIRRKDNFSSCTVACVKSQYQVLGVQTA